MSVIAQAAPCANDVARRLLTVLADGGMHEEEHMAARLGVSSTLLRVHAESLRQLGLPLARAGTGPWYLPWPLELLDAAAIEAALDPATHRRLAKIEVLWRPSSTSDIARQRLATGSQRAAIVVLAESQRAGRGRRGRTWLAPPGLSLCLSLACRLPIGPDRLAGLSLALGVQLRRALAECVAGQVRLKWPNDMLLGDAKLAGILIEVDGSAAAGTRITVGVGMNLRAPAGLAEQAGQPVAGLFDGARNPPSRNLLAARLIAALLHGLDRFATAGFAPFAAEFERFDALRGRDLAIIDGHGTWYGEGCGVDASGALRVRRGDAVVSVASADVSVRPR